MLWGALSNLVILTNLWQSCIIHTLTKPAKNNLEIRALKGLKCRGLWRSLGIGRFRCLHSLLMWAIRCANSEHSALNAGVPTNPHSPEYNSSYLAWIWSITELYSLCASCTVIKKTGLCMIRSDKYKFWVISMSETSEMPKQVWSMWNIWANFLPPNWLKLNNCVIQVV